MNTDSITVLRARGRRLAKLVRADGTLQDYDSVRTLDMFAMPLAGQADVARLLCHLLHRPDCCIVRGAIADPTHTRRVRRLVHLDRKTGEVPTLLDVPRQWLALDIEGVERPDGAAASDLPACAGEAIQRLPAAFRGARCIVQATGGHGIKPGCRIRLWYWLSRPTLGGELKRWLRGTPSDPSVFRAAQPIYTAAPLFEAGHDHLPHRMTELPGAELVLVPQPEALQPPQRKEAPRHLPSSADTNAARYAAAALRNAAARIMAASVGKRHDTLLGEARALARFKSAGLLTERDIRQTLEAAAEQAGKPDGEAGAVLDWAIDHPSSAALPEGIAA